MQTTTTETEKLTITAAELIDLLAGIRGTTFATVTTRKTAKLNKKNRETAEARDFEVMKPRALMLRSVATTNPR